MRMAAYNYDEHYSAVDYVGQYPSLNESHNGSFMDYYGYYGYDYDYDYIEGRQKADHVTNTLFLYAAPVLIITGTAGNLLAFRVLMGKIFRKAPSSLVLGALALADTAVLLTGLLRHWIRSLVYATTGQEYDVRTASLASCRLHIVLTYFFLQLSPWILVLMTVERMFSVMRPLTARRFCSKPRMIIALVIIAIVLFGIDSCMFKTIILHSFSYEGMDGVTITHYSCHYSDEAEHFQTKIWPWIDLLLHSLLPGLIIIITNLMIIMKIAQARKRRHCEMKVQGQDSDEKSRSLTAMLISVSVFFIVTTLPATVFFIGESYWPKETGDHVYTKALAFSVTNIIMYTNYTFNFALYCVTGARFRQALRALFCWRQYQMERRSSLSSQYKMNSMRKASYSRSTSVSTVSHSGDTAN